MNVPLRFETFGRENQPATNGLGKVPQFAARKLANSCRDRGSNVAIFSDPIGPSSQSGAGTSFALFEVRSNRGSLRRGKVNEKTQRTQLHAQF
jgi:hypothetical protein